MERTRPCRTELEQIATHAADRGLTMRLFEETDRAFHLDLVASTFYNLPTELLAPAQAAQLIEQQYQLRQRGYQASFPDALRLTVERQGTPVASLWLDCTDHQLHIVDIIVDPAERGAGVGTAVIEAVRDHAVATERTVNLMVSTGNTSAQRLYARLGFVEQTRDDAFITMTTEL